MSDTTTTESTGTTVTLVYSPSGSNRVIKKFFKGMSEDDIVAVSAALVGRRVDMPELHESDVKQLKDSHERQIRWYTDRMAEALAEGMGRWFRWAPKRARKVTLDLLSDYLRGATATLISELTAAHSEIHRTHEQARALRLQPRPEPVAEPSSPAAAARPPSCAPTFCPRAGRRTTTGTRAARSTGSSS